MKKIKWEHILLFFLELLVNMATVGVAILLNALIDAAQISITSGNTYYLQKTLLISILYAVCLGILIFYPIGTKLTISENVCSRCVIY